jgi:cob(I)alamin adenosyltransferase
VPFAAGDGKLRIDQAAIDRLEADCDDANAALPELKSFVLPGGTEARRACTSRALDLLAARRARLPEVSDLAGARTSARR